MTKRRDMTVGSPTKALIMFALPIFLGQLFQQFYNLTDTKVIGSVLKDEGLAAISSVSSIYTILIGIANGLNNGCAIIAARMHGAHNGTMLKRTVAHMLVINFSVTAVFMVIGLLFVDVLMGIMKVPPDIYGDARIYLMFILCGMATTIAYNMCAALLRSIGNSVTPLIFLILCTALNAGLDVLFVMVLPFGIAGAAAATIIAQAVSVILCLSYIIKKCPELHIGKKDFVFDFNLTKELVSLGLSMGLITSLVSFGSAAVSRANNILSAQGYGNEVLTANTAARRIDGFVMMPLSTLGTALSTFVSQNLGAGQIQRIRKAIRSALGIGAAWSAVGVSVIYAFGGNLVQLVTSTTNSQTIEYAVKYMRINVPFLFTLLVLLVFRSVLQGIGKKIIPIVTAAAELVLKFFAASVLVPRYGFIGVCVSEPIIWALTAIIVSVVYIIDIKKLLRHAKAKKDRYAKRKKKWKKRKIKI